MKMKMKTNERQTWKVQRNKKKTVIENVKKKIILYGNIMEKE